VDVFLGHGVELAWREICS